LRSIYKILFAGLLVALLLGLFMTLNVLYQRHQVVETATNGAFRVSETVRRSLWHAMMEGDQKNVRQILNSVGQQEGINKIRVFNQSGEIIYSTDRSEEGTQVNAAAESCLACHSRIPPQAAPAKKDRVRFFRTPLGRRVLGLITPIPNEPACSTAACHVHPAGQRILGVLDIDMSLTVEDQALTSYQGQIIGLGLLTILLAAVGVSLIVQRYFVSPVRRLLKSSREAQGLGPELPPAAPSGRDELEQLQNIFEGMSSRLRESRDQLLLSERLSSVGRVASSVAHEVNNPLTSILTTSSMLVDDLPDGDPRKRQMKTMFEETLRVRDILRRMLDLARPTPARKEPTDLNLLMVRSLQLMRNYLAVLNTKAELDLEPGLPRIEASPGQMQQVILNLLLNAADAMPQGGKVRLQTRSLPGEREIEVRCTDTGVGIAPSDQEKIFQPFYSTKGERGTGLGLAITREIVRDHGGTIRLESEPGRGATFIVRLPVPNYVQGDLGADPAKQDRPGTQKLDS
jgi:two-component system, NtrC family, sensor kinase